MKKISKIRNIKIKNLLKEGMVLIIILVSFLLSFFIWNYKKKLPPLMGNVWDCGNTICEADEKEICPIDCY